MLVNNAGICRPGNLPEQKEEDIDAQIDVNLRGLIKLTKAFLPQMLQRKEGRIIQVASGAGLLNCEPLPLVPVTFPKFHTNSSG